MAAKRIPSLDGLRAISILFVLLGHLSHTPGFPFPGAFLTRFADFGVRVFFVISGYLITGLLLDERREAGTISLYNFYGRRSVRIFPAAYTFMAVAIALNWTTLSKTNIATAITYTQNFSARPQWILGHLWSLAVEEQFYFLWPFLLTRFFGLRRTMLWTVIAAVPLANVVLIATNSPLWGRAFMSVADVLAVGCMLAIWQADGSTRLQSIVNSRYFWLVPVFAVVSAPLLTLKYPLALSALRTLLWRPMVHFAIALSVAAAVRRPYAILNTRPVVWIGTLSYSLYLWQQMFANNESPSWIGRFPQNLLLLVIAAVGCHYAVEKPFLRLRKRFQRAPKRIAAAA